MLDLKLKRACQTKKMMQIDLLIVMSITEFITTKKINVSHLKVPPNICLADKELYIPNRIDIIIGLKYF